MTVANTRNAIFSPAVRARTCMIVREIVPRVAIRAVILAHGSPLALGKVWSPAFPVNFAIGAGLQPLLFGCHLIALKACRTVSVGRSAWQDASLPASQQSANALLESRLACILVASNLGSEASPHRDVF